VNLVFAGPSGAVGYTVVGAIPVRVSSQFLPGLYALDGHLTANDWQTFVPHDLRPHVINPSTGFTYSGNHLPIGSWYPMKSLIPGAGDTNRSRILRDLLTRQTIFTENQVKALVQNTEAAYARDIVELAIHLQQNQAYTFTSRAQAALNALIPWYQNGARMDVSNPGVAVAHFMNQALMYHPNFPGMAPLIPLYGGRQAGMSLWLRESRRGLTLVPPRPIPPDDALAIDNLLRDAWGGFVAAPNSPWQQPTNTWAPWYQGRFLTGSLSRWTTVDGHGPLQHGAVAYGPLLCNYVAALAQQGGASFNQFVPLADPDRSESLLALGQSEDDNSPYAFDQKALWEQAGLKRSPLLLATLQALGITSTQQFVIP
jgi:penicillin amidase